MGIVTVAINVHQAKTHLSKLIERVLLGEEIVIARAGKPVARLVPIGRPTGRRLPGNDKIVVAPDFDDPLPEDLLKEFEA
jgi:prevent-host-death family protein